MRTTHVTFKGREMSHTRTTYQNAFLRNGFFRACGCRAQGPPNAMGFSGNVNGTTKNPGFFYNRFCQCKFGPYMMLFQTRGMCDGLRT